MNKSFEISKYDYYIRLDEFFIPVIKSQFMFDLIQEVGRKGGGSCPCPTLCLSTYCMYQISLS